MGKSGNSHVTCKLLDLVDLTKRDTSEKKIISIDQKPGWNLTENSLVMLRSRYE